MLIVLIKEIRQAQPTGGPLVEEAHHRPCIGEDDADAERADVKESECGGQQDQKVGDKLGYVVDSSCPLNISVPLRSPNRHFVRW